MIDDFFTTKFLVYFHYNLAFKNNICNDNLMLIDRLQKYACKLYRGLAYVIDLLYIFVVLCKKEKFFISREYRVSQRYIIRFLLLFFITVRFHYKVQPSESKLAGRGCWSFFIFKTARTKVRGFKSNG